MDTNPSTISTLITTLNEVLFLNKQPIISSTKTDADMLIDFENKWGYSIPDILIQETIGNKSIYKLVPQNYTNKNNHLIKREVQDIDYPLAPYIIPSKRTNLEMEKTDQINPEKEQLKIEPLKIKKEITLTHDKNTQKEQSIITKKTNVVKKKKNLAPKQQTITVKIQKNTVPTVSTKHQSFIEPTVNPTTKDLQKKIGLLKILFTRYNVKSEGHLKIKLAQECTRKNSIGQGSIINGSIWEYFLTTNTLVINTNGLMEIKDCWENLSSDSATD